MRLFPWFRSRPRHDPKQQAEATARLRRVMANFQQELESIHEPTEKAAPGQLPEILTRAPAPDARLDPSAPRYPWERQPEPEVPPEPRRRY